ncbi:bifunctional UDP-N-acetylglucosamine diphosphorylase/glucosamine-1-phosphate N-acetyltransferase GlmU [bacterium]|nr:bifunctional UDP-N-acetylglucosamine diphosphorylase/glucosamine-1-phosphate N-acetyltransferase GlmU [bacterium]
MKSESPKVLIEVAGRPFIHHILRSIHEAFPGAPVGVVVGYGKEQVQDAVRGDELFSKMKIDFIHQPQQMGTGDAARCAMESPWGKSLIEKKSTVLVLPGDLPLIPPALISQMCDALPRTTALRLLTCDFPDPTGYGRVIRRGKEGGILRIVEEKDANLREKAVHEVAASIYLFQSSFLQASLNWISNKNAQGEYYLTDIVERAVKSKKKVEIFKWTSHEDLCGVNNPLELAQAQKFFNQKIINHWAEQGVRFVDCCSAWVDVSVKIEEGATIYPNVYLRGKTRVKKGATLEPGVILTDTEVGEGALIKAGTIADKSVIGSKANVGPYAHLRPESNVGARTKIGNFVELKKARIGSDTSIAHLSYVGDAEVGDRVNIGCGFVTCNFDGRVIDGQRKHRTVIEDDVFLGSDCQTVAPVKIGKGAYIASGSTITEDVEPEALAIARSRQVNKPGYAKKVK